MGSTEVKTCITHELNSFKKNKELESNQRRYTTQAQEGTFNSSSELQLIVINLSPPLIQQTLRRRLEAALVSQLLTSSCNVGCNAGLGWPRWRATNRHLGKGVVNMMAVNYHGNRMNNLTTVLQ